MTSIVQEMIEILTSGLAQFAQGFSNGFKELIQSIFITTTTGSGGATTTELSVVGGVVLSFAAISLAVGLCTFVVKWIMSLGARN